MLSMSPAHQAGPPRQQMLLDSSYIHCWRKQSFVPFAEGPRPVAKANYPEVVPTLGYHPQRWMAFKGNPPRTEYHFHLSTFFVRNPTLGCAFRRSPLYETGVCPFYWFSYYRVRDCSEGGRQQDEPAQHWQRHYYSEPRHWSVRCQASAGMARYGGNALRTKPL